METSSLQESQVQAISDMLPISQIKTDDNVLKYAQKSALDLSADIRYPNDTIEELKSRLSKAHPDHEPFLLVFLAYANRLLFNENHKAHSIHHELQKAIRIFRRIDSDGWNEAITHWYLGTIYRDGNEQILAEQEFGAAKKLLTCIGAFSELKGDYEIRDHCLELLKQIEKDANSPPIVTKQKKRRQQNPIVNQKLDTFLLPIIQDAQLAFPVYDFVHAGTRGIFIFDDDTISDITFNGPKISEKEFQIFNVRGGNTTAPIRIQSSSKYFWGRVSGNSMNKSTPVPIDNGDYILVNMNIQPVYNDIVVAALAEPTSLTDRAGVVKRFTRKGLVSESTDYYENIKLMDTDIRGVVIAVAKPIKTYQRGLIKLFIDKDIEFFGVNEIDQLISNLSKLLNIKEGEIEVVYITSGTSRITLELPDEKVPELLRIFAEGKLVIPNINITHIEGRRASEIPNIPNYDDYNDLPPRNETEIHNTIINDPIVGARMLSSYLGSLPKFVKYQIEVETYMSELIKIQKEEQFGRTDNLAARWTHIVHYLLKILSSIK